MSDEVHDHEAGILRNLLAHTTRAYEEQVAALSREKELAQVTLASIGDGVVSTDERGIVRYLNPVAESLTGWSLDEAVGSNLDLVFRLVEESTGEESSLYLDRDLLAGTRELGGGNRLLIRRDGKRFAVEHSVAPIRDSRGRVIGLVIVFQDVTDQRLMALQLAHQASHDALTGLLNRKAFDTQLREAVAEARRTASQHCLCYMDLDQFKLVNDTCGHLAGDELLRRVAGLILDEVRETDLVGRLGGDEFAVLVPHCSVEEGIHVADRIHRSLQDFRFTWRDETFAVGVSIGIVAIDEASEGVSRLLAAADHACYLAKDKGRNRIQVYRPDDAELVQRTDEMNWVLRIQRTLEEGRFELYAQPIYALDAVDDEGRATHRPTFFEVLVRMVGDERRLLGPGPFVRAAERYGLMGAVDRWVVRHGLEALARFPAARLAAIETCSINLSALSLGDESFLEFLAEQVTRHGTVADKLCFEITETAAVTSDETGRRLMREMTALGCRFSLDDFGSGTSSYARLKGLEVGFLKIDRTFIRDLAHSALDRAMVESIHQMAQVLGVQTVAEGVSSRPLLERLREVGVDWVQGYYLGRPRPLEDLA